MKQNKVLIGSIILTASSLISKFFGAFYKIPLTKVLGTSGLGIYQMIFPIFTLFVMLASSGLVVSVSKNVAVSKHQKNKINQCLNAGFFVATTISSALSIIFALLAPVFSANQGNINFAKCYFLVLPSIFLSGICAVFRGYFFGKNQMSTNGFVQVIEQLSKILFALLFAKLFSVFGVVWTVGGALLGITASEIVATSVYFVCFKKQTKSNLKYSKVLKPAKKLSKTKQMFFAKVKKISFWSTAKQIFATSFFVTLQASILPLISAIDGIVLIPMLLKSGLNSQIAYSVFGIATGIASSILSLPIVVASSAGSAIIPNIQQSNSQAVSKKITFAIKIVWLASIGFCTVFLAVPNQIVEFLFAGSLHTKFVDEFQICSDILRISCFGSVYLCLLTISTSILQGLGKSKTSALNVCVSAVLRFAILSVLFWTDNFSIYSVSICDMVCYGSAFLLNLLAIKKQSQINISITQVLVYPLLSAGLMALVILTSKSVFTNLLSPKLLTLTICFFGMVAYMLCLVLTKTIDISGIKNHFLSSKKQT